MSARAAFHHSAYRPTILPIVSIRTVLVDKDGAYDTSHFPNGTMVVDGNGQYLETVDRNRTQISVN